MHPDCELPPADLRPVRSWRLRTRILTLGTLPRLMGIVNATPDSFSDGGRYFDPAAAVAHGLQLVADGADLLDVGGESTRPGAAPVDAVEELRRVVPVVTALCEQTAVPVSIDTSKAVVAGEALAAGAEAINDISALQADPQMASLAAKSGCGVCIMHMQGSPQTMQQAPVYRDVVAEVFAFLKNRRDTLVATGVAQERIALDPGIGFGKDLDHNLALLANAWRLHALGCPLLVGPSRKRFIGQVLGNPTVDRTAGTIGVSLALARQGIGVLRVHDVAAVRQALLLFQAAEFGGLEHLR